MEYSITLDDIEEIIKFAQKHPKAELYIEKNSDDQGDFVAIIIDDDPYDSNATQRIWELDRIQSSIC